MAGPLWYDRVVETTTTTGTGQLTLAGAVSGYQSWACVGDGNTAYYSLYAVDANGNPNGVWECGLGTYVSSGTKLSRTTVYSNSSGTTSALSLAAGTYRVILTPIAYYFNNDFGNGSDGAVTISADTNWATSSGVDDTGYVLKQFTSLTINASKVVTAANRAQVMVVKVQGNCTINGTLHMDSKGAAATALSPIQVARFANTLFGEKALQFFTIPAVGASGAATNSPGSAMGAAGSNGLLGQTGGGGSAGGGQGGGSYPGSGGAGRPTCPG